MLLRSNLLRICTALLLCVSMLAAEFVQQSEYGKCDYEYLTMVDTTNITTLKTYTDGDTAVGSSTMELSQALDICSGMDSCYFLGVTNSETTFTLYGEASYEVRNESDSSVSADDEVYVYMKVDSDECVAFSSYGYIYDTFTYTASDKCPSSRRRATCSYQNETSDVEADCPTVSGDSEKQLCCFNDGASSGEKCTNSYLYTCDVPSLTSEIGDATITSPSSEDLAADETDQHIVYIGEAITITCNSNKMFAYADGWDVDTNSKTTLTCVLDSVTKKTTDMVTTYRQGMCSDTCDGVYYDSDTTVVNHEFPTRKNTKLDVTCKDGYGLEGGYTSENPQCSTGEWLAITNCTSCVVPTAPTGATYSPTGNVKPTGTVMVTCASGYSLLGLNTATCKRNSSSTTGWTLATPPTCHKMCSLDLNYGGDYPHSVPGNVTYLAYTSSIELSCPGGTLPVGQSSTLKCDTAGAVISPLRCDVECTTTGAVDNALLKVDGATADTKVPAGTVITAECKSSYGVYYGKSTTFNCSGYNYDATAAAGSRFKDAPECLRTCTLEILSSVADSLGQAYIIIGNSRNVTTGDELLQGETVNIPCLDDDHFVVKDHKTSQNLTCESSSPSLYPDECQKPCKISDLSGGNNNTVISPNPEVGIGSKVTFTCNDNYQLGEGSNTKDTSLVTCKSGAILSPSTIPVQSTCYPVPTMTASGDGEQKITVQLSLPSDYDRDTTITKVVFKDGSTVLETLTNVAGLQGSSASQDITLNYGRYASSAPIEVNVYYDGVSASKDVSGTSPTGPPTLTYTSAPTVTFTGRTSFTITAPGSNKDSILSTYSSAKLRADFYLKTSKRATGSVVYSMDVSLSAVDGSTAVSIPSGKLAEGKSYTMKLTTYVSGAEGGSVELDIDTGLDAPTMTQEILTSTSNKLTITLSSGASQDAQYTVYYTVNGGSEQSETLQFSGGVATFTQTGLTAESAYTYKVCVMGSSSSTKSSAVTLQFTQGPTEPTNLAQSSLTDSSVVISWTKVDLNTYTVTLKEVNGAVETTISTNTTSDGNFTFSDDNALDAGQKYKVYVAAEMTIAGSQLSSADSVVSFTTYHCKVDNARINSELYSSSGVLVTADYLYQDASAVFNISCATGYAPKVAEGVAIDNTTSCIGANEWSTFDDCEVQEAAVEKENDSDVVVGVVLGILAVVIIIAIILILIYRRNQRKSSSNRYNPSAEEKKSNEKADGGEAWRNPYYVETEKGAPAGVVEVEIEPALVVANNDADIPPPDPVYDVELEIKEGTPDIPEPLYDNDIADKGDNVSQEVKIEFQDNEDDGNEVHENKLADANV